MIRFLYSTILEHYYLVIGGSLAGRHTYAPYKYVIPFGLKSDEIKIPLTVYVDWDLCESYINLNTTIVDVTDLVRVINPQVILGVLNEIRHEIYDGTWWINYLDAIETHLLLELSKLP